MILQYPLEGIVESESLRGLFGRIRESVDRGKPILCDSGLIASARKDFFRELKEGEVALHDLARKLLFPFMPEGYEINWVVNAQCENMDHEETGRIVPLDNYNKYEKILEEMSDEERTKNYLPSCRICKGEMYPAKSFFIYLPEKQEKLKWGEIRVKESSAKITDKIVGLRPRRNDAIENERGEIVQDLFGIRGIFEGYEHIREAMKISRSLMENLQVKNYFMNPKSNGYEAVHIIGEHDGRVCEVQLRTENSHKAAEDESSTASHKLREKEIMRRRLNTKRWNEVSSVVKEAVSPQYEFFWSSE